MSAVYLDFAATTPVDPTVRSVMESLLVEHFGNPHSEHFDAVGPAAAIELAATQVADFICADPGEIVFTSGATEANNAAIKGVMMSPQRRGRHMIVSAIEHSCVLESARALERVGCELTVIPVDHLGRVDPNDVAAAVTPQTALVSIMLMNNEIGTVQPLGEIAKILSGKGIVFHTDAAQAAARILLNVADLGVDLLSISGHKLYGPKGIGALYVSADSPTRLEPLIHGGGQQAGRRGGTMPTFLCAALGAAAEVTSGKLLENDRKTESAAEFLRQVRSTISGTVLNGPEPTVTDAIINLRFAGADATSVLQILYGRVSASMGSACHAGSIAPSHVLQAIGLNETEASESIRFSVGRTTTTDDISRAAIALKAAVTTVRSISL